MSQIKSYFWLQFISNFFLLTIYFVLVLNVYLLALTSFLPYNGCLINWGQTFSALLHL